MPPPITTEALWFGRLRCLWHLGHRATEPGPHGQRFEPPQRTVPRPALASTRSCKGCSILSHFRDPQQPSFLFWDCLIKWRKSEKEFLVVGQDRTSFNMGVFSDRPTVHEAFCQGNKVLELWNSLQRLYAQPRSWISPRRSRQIQLGTRVKLCQAQVLALRLRKV